MKAAGRSDASATSPSALSTSATSTMVPYVVDKAPSTSANAMKHKLAIVLTVPASTGRPTRSAASRAPTRTRQLTVNRMGSMGGCVGAVPRIMA